MSLRTKQCLGVRAENLIGLIYLFLFQTEQKTEVKIGVEVHV